MYILRGSTLKCYTCIANLNPWLTTLSVASGDLPLYELKQLLMSFTRQVVSGLGYLSLKGFVHRDLAARNVLVSDEGICKVCLV